MRPGVAVDFIIATPAASRYHVIRRIAVGGMGEIFLARQQIAGVNRLVVLKRLLPELAEDPERLAMFVDEARIAANLAHPGIVQVHEFGQDAEGHFIVMEYVPGHHVGRVMARAARDGRPIPVRIGAFVVHEVARALDHAHHARDSSGAPLHIVHRDISPSNVLVSFAGDVKLMDFGIARAANRSHRTSDGTIRGKFAYMAPEQIEATEVDSKSDVFAAGILLWELTLGRRLFDGATDFETIRATLEQPIPRPTSIDPHYPPDLEEIAMAALDRARDRRLASASDLAAGLRAYLRTAPTDRDDLATLMASLFPGEAAEDEPHAPQPAAPTVKLAEPAPVSEPAPRRARIWLVLVAGLVAVAAVVAVAVRPSEAPRAAAVPITSTTPPPVHAALAVTPLDAAEDAPPDVAPAPGKRKVSKHAGVPPDAAPIPMRPDATEQATAVEGTLHFRAPGEHRSIYVTPPAGITCINRAIQTRCRGAVGTYVFGFAVAGGESFATPLRIVPGLSYCDVDPSRKAATCESN